MPTPSDTFTEMVSTTLRHHERSVADNVTNHNALLRYMKEHNNIKTDAGGGYEIAIPLSYAENETYQRFHGGEILDISDSDVLTTAKFDWRQVALHVTTTGRDLKLNRGKAQLINLVKARVQVAMDTAANNMSVDIYSDGALSNQIGGLQHIIQSGGQGTVGSINSATWTFWRNQVREMSDPTAFASLKADMNLMWLSCVRGMDKPDLIVFSHDLYSVYEGGLQDLQRYADSKAAGLGFESLKYKSASLIFDDNTNFGTTAERGYFLNTKYLYMQQHPEAQWDEDEKKIPINQDKIVLPIYWMGEMCCSNRKRQGVMVDLA